MCFMPKDARDISELDETERNKLLEGGAVGDTFEQVTACVHLPYEINRDLSPQCFPKGSFCVYFIFKPKGKTLFFNGENVCIGDSAMSAATDKSAYERVLNGALSDFFINATSDFFK